MDFLTSTLIQQCPAAIILFICYQRDDWTKGLETTSQGLFANCWVLFAKAYIQEIKFLGQKRRNKNAPTVNTLRIHI